PVPVQTHLAAVEDTDHAAFPVHGGNDRNAEIHWPAPDHDRGSAVLRTTPFAEVEIGQNFNSCDDRRGGREWLLHDCPEIAVNAIADDKGVGSWLEMDIRRPA